MACAQTNADFRPANYNIQIWQNDTWSQVLTLTANLLPISLVGADVKIQIRKKPNSTTAELTLTETNGAITVGGVFVYAHLHENGCIKRATDRGNHSKPD
jgi:hypothetical protein